MVRRAPLLAALLLLSAAVPSAAAAHAPRQSYIFLRMHSDSVVVRLELNVAHLDSALGLGWGGAARPAREQVQAHLARIRGYAEARLSMDADGRRLAPTYRGFGLSGTDAGTFVQLEYVVRTATPRALRITYTPFFDRDADHRNLLVVEHDWKTGTFGNEGNVSLIFSPSAPTQTLDLTRSSLWRGFAALVRLGVWHIWIGLDHILFLIALVLPSVLQRREGRWHPAPSFRSALLQIVAIVTCFTVAHTLTLSLAALDVVRLPSRLVEAVIAGSIAAAALHNLWPRVRVSEPAIAFVFGLFHGFGFASVLGDIGLGRDHLVLSLLGFNLGVELGQVAIILAVFPALFLLRRLPAYGWMLRLGSAGLVAIGLLWTAERALDFNVPLVPIARAAGAWITGGPSRA
jgi:hypothetical protein